MVKYNKLVRDRIPEIIRSKGSIPVTHIADDREYGKKLHEKLQEEVKEYLEKPSEEELADILEVVRAIIDYRGVDWESVEALRVKKNEERGGFKDRIILDETKD